MSTQPKEVQEATEAEVDAIFGEIEQADSKKPIKNYGGVSKDEMDAIFGPLED